MLSGVLSQNVVIFRYYLGSVSLKSAGNPAINIYMRKRTVWICPNTIWLRSYPIIKRIYHLRVIGDGTIR